MNCSSLKTLNINNFKTSNVADMSTMFGGCSSLESLDVSSFDTSKVKKMHSMFESCKNLKNVKGVENFNTSNVENMCDMFKGCEALSADCSGWNVVEVTKHSGFRNINENTANTNIIEPNWVS